MWIWLREALDCGLGLADLIVDFIISKGFIFLRLTYASWRWGFNLWENYVWGRGRKTVAQVTECRGSEEGWKQGKRGKTEFFFCVVFHSLVFLSKSTLSGSTAQNMNGYIYKKLMKLKIFIIPWRPFLLRFSQIFFTFPHPNHPRLCSLYFIIFYLCRKLIIFYHFFMYVKSKTRLLLKK